MPTEMRHTPTYLPQELREWVEKLAEESGRSVASTVRELVRFARSTGQAERAVGAAQD